MVRDKINKSLYNSHDATCALPQTNVLTVRSYTVGLSMFKLSLNIDLNGYMVIIFTALLHKKLGRRRFFSHKIRAQKDNSIATPELHVETK